MTQPPNSLSSGVLRASVTMALPARIVRVNKATFVTVCVLAGSLVGVVAHDHLRRADDPILTTTAPLPNASAEADQAPVNNVTDGATHESNAEHVAATDHPTTASDTTTTRPLSRQASTGDEGRMPDAINESEVDDTMPSGDVARTGKSTNGSSVSLPPAQTWSYHDGIMRAAPSIVSLYASVIDEEAQRLANQGSGVIIDASGIVLTNLHLLEGADMINVVLSDGTLHTGMLMGSDRETDLAVVSINADGLPALSLDEAPPLRVGDVVLAIGNPFGVGQTVTQGIVSATRRRVAGGSAWMDFVQIDAAINPGSSGGALINPAGQLVGVTTAVFRGNAHAATNSNADLALGIGFAIPSDLLTRVVPEIIADGRVLRGWLGIEADDLPMFPDLHRANKRGAVITAVNEDSPALAAGLQPRDIVIDLDGRDISNATQLLLMVSAIGPGTVIELTVRRGSENHTVPVTLGERPLPETKLPR